MDKALARDEAAVMLGVKPQSVWITMTRRGYKPVSRQPGRRGQLLWRPSDIHALVKSKKLQEQQGG